MYIDNNDSIAQKTGSRRLIKKRSTFCPVAKSENALDYELSVNDFKIFEDNKGLSDFKDHFEARQQQFITCLNQIFRQEYQLETFAQQYEQFGVLQTPEGYIYREYAPNALELYLIGDFNHWNLKQYPLVNDGNGLWKLTLPEGVEIEHGTRVAAYVRTWKNKWVTRVPIGARYISKLENPIIKEDLQTFCEVFWNPKEKYVFKHMHPHKPRAFKIYRAEITKAGPEKRNYTYNEFAESELDRIKQLGYNTVLLVGIQEHQSRGSSYSVINPYAINSSAGTPDDLKRLVDKAHQLGLFVTMDIVQTHASPEQGFNEWDGSHFSYFMEGEEGVQTEYGGRRFNFAKWETQRLLLSNLGYFLNEYKIDGFRFHDVPSIIYKNPEKGKVSGKWDDQLRENSCLDGLTYLMIANETVHKINSNAVTFAEDDSNYPSLCLPLNQGGIGFDYRISIKAADEFAQHIVNTTQVDFQQLISLLDARSSQERVISSLCYKSSDIILKEVRDKFQDLANSQVQKHLSLHKIARMIAIAYAGESYLNRYGNELGSSEEYLRTDLLGMSPYKELMQFDKEILQMEEIHQILSMPEKSVTQKSDGILVFERASLIFIFNLTGETHIGFQAGTKWNSHHSIIFNTDDIRFGGMNRVAGTKVSFKEELINSLIVRPFRIIVDLPSYCGIIIQPYDTESSAEERKE